MGSNMQRQALPLERNEISLIETGIEKLIAKESQSTIISKKSGKVKYANTKKIVIEEKIRKIKYINTKSTVEKIKNLANKKYRNDLLKTKEISYFLENPRKSNQNSYLYQKPIVKKNEWIKKGQIIADGAGSLNGKLSLGKNILIGYIGWEGYNFEDAIIINERLVNDDIFTSIHIKKYKTFILNNEKGEVRININIKIKPNALLIIKKKDKCQNRQDTILMNKNLSSL
jgi:DNA-directed RNA polymerase subunit beta